MTGLEGESALPSGPGADRPPEERGVRRDEVRLLETTESEERFHRFSDLPGLLRRGDLLVVNESATVPASLPARSALGEFRVNLSTSYGPGLWVAEPRWGPGAPGPLPIEDGAALMVGGVRCTVVAHFPGVQRLVFLQAHGDLAAAMSRCGEPIRYGYAARDFPLKEYQTIFSRVPGSAEMPSAARPFTAELVSELRAHGIEFAPLILHAGVSSLETGDFAPGTSPVFPEPFEVPSSTVEAILRTRSRGGRVVAVGTTVVRALESVRDDCGLRSARGFTRVYLSPDRPVRTVDALLTGFHEARSTHVNLLAAFAGMPRIRRAYEVAPKGGLLWHEFGDSHLIWAPRPA